MLQKFKSFAGYAYETSGRIILKNVPVLYKHKFLRIITDTYDKDREILRPKWVVFKKEGE